jgi:hypothetical protein
VIDRAGQNRQQRRDTSTMGPKRNAHSQEAYDRELAEVGRS